MVHFGVCQLDFQVTHSITEGNQWRSLKQKPIKQHWLLPAYGYLSHVAQAHLSREWPVHSGLPLLHHYAIKKWPIKEPTDQTDEATPPLRVSLLGCVKLAITGTHHICHWKAEQSRRYSPNASTRAMCGISAQFELIPCHRKCSPLEVLWKVYFLFQGTYVYSTLIK